MDQPLELDAMAGFGAGLDELPVALRSLRARLLDLGGSLGADDWQQPSRCHLWTVHDVVRHVRDACRMHVEGLRGGPSPFDPARPFSARETPLRWLEESAGESPAETMAELSDLCAQEGPALDARLEQGGDEVIEGPYGPVHWTVLSTHVLWDGWLHDRDVTQALGVDRPGSSVEDPVVAAYALLIASIPAAGMGHPLDVSVGLTSPDGNGYTTTVRPGRAVLAPETGSGEAQLHGELAPVVDALAGRGPELAVVLHGDQAAREPLTWMRSVMVPVP